MSREDVITLAGCAVAAIFLIAMHVFNLLPG